MIEDFASSIDGSKARWHRVGNDRRPVGAGVLLFIIGLLRRWCYNAGAG
jgi:hypothetical protein